jgi:DNA polymerase (family 10)
VKLEKKFPAGLVGLTRIPGLGPKTARKIYEELGISSLEALRDAAESERLRSIPGLGPQAEQNILESLAALTTDGDGGERRLLSAMLPLGQQIVEELRAHPASEKVELAGSVRRMTDTCKDIDIIATARDPLALSKALGELEIVLENLSGGEAGARVITNNGVVVELRVAAPKQFGNLL